MPSKRSNQKPVAFEQGIISYEPDLPLPYVHYPGHYGAFIGFSTKPKSSINFCSCAEPAIENYLAYLENCNDAQHPFTYAIIHFPLGMMISGLKGGVNIRRLRGSIKYREKICHLCLQKVPLYSYCHEMYGGKFRQSYGWYISAKEMEWKSPSGKISGNSPREYKGLYTNKLLPLNKKIQSLEQGLPAYREVAKKRSGVLTEIYNMVENEVRGLAGYRNVGEGWVTETEMFYILKQIFPQNKVYKHNRPIFLEGLELDVYIPKHKLGFEYQGEQHYKAMKHYGGEDSLKGTQSRDRKKRKLCEENGVTLIEITYKEELSPRVIIQKIREKRPELKLGDVKLRKVPALAKNPNRIYRETREPVNLNPMDALIRDPLEVTEVYEKGKIGRQIKPMVWVIVLLLAMILYSVCCCSSDFLS